MNNINKEKNKSTSFIIITKQKVYLKDANKISISFDLPHESGSLYRILSHFIYNDLNMTKIESRPIEGRNWEYRFFVDFEGNMEQPAVKNALRGLREVHVCGAGTPAIYHGTGEDVGSLCGSRWKIDSCP